MEKMPESQIKLGRDFPPNISMGRGESPLRIHGPTFMTRLLSRRSTSPPDLLRCKTAHLFHPMSNDFHITGFSCKIISNCCKNENLRSVWFIFSLSLWQTPLDRFPIALLRKSETTEKLSVMQQIKDYLRTLLCWRLLSDLLTKLFNFDDALK